MDRNTQLHDLIEEGNKYTFQNNSSNIGSSVYSKATPEFLSWVSKIEDYIRSNYNENSGPYKLIETLRREKLSENYQSEFEAELAKLKGAIGSCKHVEPNKTKNKEDHIIISLLKNYIFWTVLVVVSGGAYKLGYDNGVSKFDKTMIEQNKEIELLKDASLNFENTIQIKDSTIFELKSKLK